ncbi:sulfotransferase domain-containing protein [Amylibacter sp.]|nr:sulfotransferase domain-containing protein [Amylibacter sp.]
MKTLYFHIGFPKTGTTTFYKYIAPQLEDISVFIPNNSQEILKNNLSENEFSQSLKLKNFLETFLYTKDGHEEAIKILQSSQHEKVFLSTVNLMAGQFFEGLYSEPGCYIDARLISQRIYEALSEHFNIKILISVRTQADWIHSAFAEWHNLLPNGSGGGNFQNFISACTTRGNPQRAALDYHSLGNVFEEKFGMGNVMFVFYEELKMDASSYFLKIASWLGSSLTDEVLSSISRANNRSVSLNSKKTDVGSLLLFLFSLKMKFIPNARFNIANRAPTVLKLLKSISFQRYKTIEMSENNKFLIQKEFQESNKLFVEKYSSNAEWDKLYLQPAINRNL